MSADAMAGHRLRAFDIERMLTTDPPPVPWIVDGLVAQGMLTMLAGREGIGKSMFAAALAVGIAAGGARVGPMTCHGGTVLIVDAENGEAEAHRRIRGLGLPQSALSRLAWYGCEAGDLLNPAGLPELEAAIAEREPSLVVLDSFASLWRGRENEAESVGPDLDSLRNMLRHHGVAGLLLHHEGKGGNGYRGSTAIGAACEIAAHLRRHEGDDDQQRVFIQPDKVRPAQRWPRKWMRLSAERGAVLVDEADPFTAGDAAPVGRPPVVREQVGDQIARLLAGADEPLSQAAIIRALGRKPGDQTTRRVLEAMVEGGEAARVDGGFTGVSEGQAPIGGLGVVTPPRDGWED